LNTEGKEEELKEHEIQSVFKDTLFDVVSSSFVLVSPLSCPFRPKIGVKAIARTLVRKEKVKSLDLRTRKRKHTTTTSVSLQL
jgi:hypothetical protein